MPQTKTPARSLAELKEAYEANPHDKNTKLELACCIRRAHALGFMEGEVLSEGDRPLCFKLFSEIAVAEPNSPVAKVGVGFCYWEGIGVKRDVGMAAMTFESAAQNGSQIAMNALWQICQDIMLEKGTFTPDELKVVEGVQTRLLTLTPR